MIKNYLTLLMILPLFFSCQQTANHSSCYDKLFQDNAEKSIVKQIKQEFLDTLDGWLAMAHENISKKYKWTVGGIIYEESSQRGLILLYKQKKVKSRNADGVKMVLFHKDNFGFHYFHKGILQIGFSRFADESVEEKIPIDSLKALCKDRLINKFDFIDESGCKINSDFWTNYNIPSLQAKHSNWLKDPSFF